jgi:hypothetical protein
VEADAAIARTGRRKKGDWGLGISLLRIPNPKSLIPN